PRSWRSTPGRLVSPEIFGSLPPYRQATTCRASPSLGPQSCPWPQPDSSVPLQPASNPYHRPAAGVAPRETSNRPIPLTRDRAWPGSADFADRADDRAVKSEPSSSWMNLHAGDTQVGSIILSIRPD